jgi:hypothetical protein
MCFLEFFSKVSCICENDKKKKTHLNGLKACLEFHLINSSLYNTIDTRGEFRSSMFFLFFIFLTCSYKRRAMRNIN